MADFVALVSNEKEFAAVKEFAAQNAAKKILCISHEFWPESQGSLANLAVCREEELLSEKELELIEERALFFARNWFKFDGKFEKACVVQGIQLGFVSDFAIFNIFRKIFLLLLSGGNAIAREKPEAVVAAGNSFSGACAEIVAGGKKVKLRALQIAAEEKTNVWINFNPKKLSEAFGKLGEILKDSGGGAGPGAKTVFVKGSWYFKNVENELRQDSSLNVVSLDTFVLRKMLLPWNFLSYVRTMKEKRAFFSKIFAEFEGSRAFREKMVFQGMGFGEAFARCTPRFSLRDWPEFCFVIEKLYNEFEKKKPSVAVVWDDFIPFERIVVLLARKFNAKSIVLQHGIFIEKSRLPGWIRSFVPLTADKIAVWGPVFRKMLEEKGVSKERIAVTGAPRLDALGKRKFDNDAFREKMGWKKGEKIVVLATQPLTMHTMPPTVLAEHVADAMKAFLDARLVIKIHPLENASDYRAVLEKARSNCTLIEKTDLHQLLNCADLAIVHSSTVGLEAMILGKPTIAFAGDFLKSNFYGLMQNGFVAAERKQLAEFIEKILSGKFDKKAWKDACEKFVFEAAFKQDGLAAKRAKDEIKVLAFGRQ